LFFSSNCRFCLRLLQEDEKQIAINHYIQKQFFVITQTELKNAQTLSQIICEMCFDSTRDLAMFKTKLLINQQKLEESLILSDEEIFHENDVIQQEIYLCSPVKLEPESNYINFKVEQMSEDETEATPKEDFYEEHLDPDMIEALTDRKYIESRQQIEELELTTIEEKFKRIQKTTVEKKKLCSGEIFVIVREKMKLTNICDLDCGKSYSNQAFKRHYERVHLRLKKFHVSFELHFDLNFSTFLKFQCDYCNYKTYSRSHIEIHVRSHLKIKIFSCEQCGASFGSGSILRQHFLTHQADRPYKCQQADCNISFKSVYALRRHKKTHSDNRLKFECDECW
jgi:Zinc finger, C2H2 type